MTDEIGPDEVCAYLLVRISQLKDTVERLNQELEDAKRVNEGLTRELATLARGES